jgi:hypothetical protein
MVLKTDPAITHIPCGSQAYMLEEAHGICALAGVAIQIYTTQFSGISIF